MLRSTSTNRRSRRELGHPDVLVGANSVKAAGTIDWVAISRKEGNCRRLATLGTDNFSLNALLQTKFGLAHGSTFRAPGRNIGQTLFLVKLLFPGCPREWLAAIAAGKCLIDEIHETPPPVNIRTRDSAATASQT